MPQSFDEIKNIVADLRSQGKSIAATNGCFDVLHIGHSRYLKESKKLADVLIVGLNSDKSVRQLKGEIDGIARPVNNELDRAELLAELKSVDYVVIFEEIDAVNFLKTVKPDFYTKGGDYSQDELEKWPEYKIAQEIGAKIVLVDFVKGKSSTKIINAALK